MSRFQVRLLRTLAALMFGTALFRLLQPSPPNSIGPQASTATPRYAIQVLGPTPPETKAFQSATLACPALALSCSLEWNGQSLSGSLLSPRLVDTCQVVVYARGGGRAQAQGRIHHQGSLWQVQVSQWQRAEPIPPSQSAGSLPAAGAPALWQRPEHLLPNAPWLGRQEHLRTLRHDLDLPKREHHH